jgi:hypothetical protein
LTTRAFFGPNASAVLQQYDDHPPYARFGALLTDALVTCYVRHVARLISGASASPVRLYTHMHAPSARADPTNCRHYECTHGATCHAGDNVFTFASYVLDTLFVSWFGFDVFSRYNGIASVSFTQYEQQLSEHVADTLVSFARDSLPSWWPVYRFGRISATSRCVRLLTRSCVSFMTPLAQRRHRHVVAVGGGQWEAARQHHGISFENL